MRGPISAALVFALLSPVPALAQTADPALAVVQSLEDGLIGIMKAKGTAKSRAATIAPAIDRAFDLPLMTRLTVGTSWTGIAPADQTALVAALRRMTIARYASNFDSWSGESFTIDPNVQTRADDKLVRTSLNQQGKSPVPISYRLRQSGGSWKIIDVFYRNSISQIATRRSDFSAVLAKGGAKALVAHLDAIAAKGGG
ncbi:ABC transporter substrate-binding protein [soil metagenome]